MPLIVHAQSGGTFLFKSVFMYQYPNVMIFIIFIFWMIVIILMVWSQ